MRLQAAAVQQAHALIFIVHRMKLLTSARLLYHRHGPRRA